MAWLPVLILTSALAGQSSPPASDDGRAERPAASPAPAQPAASDRPDDRAREAARADGKKKPATPKAEKPARSKPRPAPALPAPGPRVLTRSEMQRRRSPFLDPPGSEGAAADRYGPGGVNGGEIPAWRRSSFFGIRAQGRFFVYVIDCSESMIDEDRFARATMEVRRSVLALQAPQQFEVIFYNEGSIPMPGGPQPRPADAQNKNQLVSWLRLVEPDGGTDPRAAIRQALSLRPEAVFLLSDGQFPDRTAETVARSNAHRIPIHCVDLSGGEGGDHLRRIARESGGQYASRPGNLQGKP